MQRTPITDPAAPWHAHVYYDANERAAAAALHDRFGHARRAGGGGIRFVGRMADRPVGPHPIPQFEIHFTARDRDAIAATIERSGLRALVHPLTTDDLADHTTLATWIGQPLDLDVSVLDPPGANQGLARFGAADV